MVCGRWVADISTARSRQYQNNLRGGEETAHDVEGTPTGQHNAQQKAALPAR